VASPDAPQTDGHDVIEIAARAEQKVRQIVLGILDDERRRLEAQG
jgi:hypothetical protein